MDRSTFDALTRRIARQTTRRAALATLLGGALLLHEPAASDATKEAQRRKRRRKKTSSPLKPISVVVDNTGSDSTAIVEHGDWDECCRRINTVSIPPGQSRRFDSSHFRAYVWIDNTYWFSFNNPFLFPPNITAAYDGMAGASLCCKPRGHTVVSGRSMSVGQFFAVHLDGDPFTVARSRDTNYKNFTVVMPSIH